MISGQLLVCLLCWAQVLAGTHYVTFPNALIPGLDLDVHVAVVRASGPVDIEALLQHASNNSIVSVARSTVTTGIPTVIKLPISDNIAKSQYKVVVYGSRGLTFRNESVIRFEENSLLTFIQTDKSRYSGGQEVKFRALFMRPNLLPYEGSVRLTVHDADNNMIKTENFRGTRKGVVKGSLQLGQEPVFGKWSITAEALRMGKSYMKTFQVKDYVLPKLEIKITVPKQLKDTDTSFELSVQARFTHESNVFGNCTIQIYNPDSLTHFIEYSKQIFGVVNFTVQMSTVKARLLMSLPMKVRAVVSDNATLLTMVNENDLLIERNGSQFTVTKVDKRNYYLPGMMYQTPVIVKRHGKTPGSAGSMTVIPTAYEAEISVCPSSLLSRSTSRLNVQKTVKPSFTVTFDEKGTAFLKFQTERRYDKLEFEFSVGSAKDTFTVYSFSKNFTRFMSLSADKGINKVGDRVRLQADSTEYLEGFLLFEVFARGMLLQYESRLVRQSKTTHFDLVLNADMVPQTYVVVTHVTQDGLLLQDYTVLLVNGLPFKNNVSVEVTSTTYRPRDGLQMSLRASPGSTIHVLVEDKRNRLLGVDNDIFAQEIPDKLWFVARETSRKKRSTRNSEDEEPFLGKVKRTIQKRLTATPSVKGEFIVLTDFSSPPRTPVENLLISNPNNLPERCDFHVYFLTAAQMPNVPNEFDEVLSLNYARPDHSIEIGKPQLEVQEFIRSRFPETWLWEEYETGSNGRVNVIQTLPDSVTTWVGSVFATDLATGFGIPEEKLEIKVERDFFLTMSTPPSLILGEEFLLQITVFNNLRRYVQVQIQIDRSDDPSRPIPAATVVEHGQGHSTFVKITPQQPGVLKLTARARAGDFFQTFATDMVNKEVTIRRPGIRKTINHSRFVTVSPNVAAIVERFPFGNYPNVIPGSLLIHMTITGDIMTPTATGLQDLIVAPSGCGEQNMVKFAPDVFVTKYMKATGQLTNEIETKALSYILKGYQNELSYKRPDGSYSAFTSDDYGGTWLTAYVLKCFHQARDLITIDNAVLDAATRWLLSRQNGDGSFIEQRPVRYVDHVFSELRRSAFTIISLLEASTSVRNSQFPTMSSVISKGISYLEGKLSQINDAYSLSITCYAMAKHGSSSRHSCLAKLQNMKISEGGMIYWRESGRSSTTPTTAADVEATAYGLLTYIAMGSSSQALPIAKWLVAQRNPQGGYKTTQDTVISIQALTEYTLEMRFNSDIRVQVEATGVGYAHSYTVTAANYNISYKHEVPASLSYLNVTVSGNGRAVFDVVETFYVSKGQNNNDIGVNVTVLTESLNSLTIRPVLSWKGTSTSNLLMMEIEMPTGFGADLEFIKNQTRVRKYETHRQIFVLYFDSLRPRQNVQVDVKMNREDPVVGNQPCHITVYDYYEPEKQSVTTYESGILKKANICNVCPLCTWCREMFVPNRK